MTQHRFALLLGALALLTTPPAHAQQTLTIIEVHAGLLRPADAQRHRGLRPGAPPQR